VHCSIISHATCVRVKCSVAARPLGKVHDWQAELTERVHTKMVNTAIPKRIRFIVMRANITNECGLMDVKVPTSHQASKVKGSRVGGRKAQ